MSAKEIQNSVLQCPVEKCGRKFEDKEKMMTHIQRRHPELEAAKKEITHEQEQNSNQVQNINPMRKRSLSKDIQSQVQQQQQVLIKKENNVSQSKDRNESLSLQSSNTPQIPIERAQSKDVLLSKMQQRPPTPKQGLQINKSISTQSESLRKSQDLFRKTQENNQLIEKTALSSSKEPASRTLSASSSSKQIQQPIAFKQSKLKTSGSNTKNESSPVNNKDKQGVQNESKQKQQSNVDQELIKSILMTISRAENKEQSKNLITESSLPKEEVQSEDEEVDKQSQQSSSKAASRPSTANNQANQSELSKKSQQSDSNLINNSGSQLSLNDVKKQRQVTIQEILNCKKKISCEYLLEHSPNQTNDIAFIETLVLKEEDLIVFEDGLTDAKFDLMVSLQYLSLSHNQLINIVSLSKFSASLLELNINFNQIQDINPLYECFQLQKLWASHNLISSITCLKQLKNLQILSLYNNQITSFSDTLRELHNLEELDLADNPCSKDQFYKQEVLSSIKSNKFSKLDSAAITSQEIQASKTYSNNKNNNNQKNNTQVRPGSAPLKVNPRTGLSASMIVNNQIKEKHQIQQQESLKEKLRENNHKDKEKITISNEEYQKTQKIKELEKQLSEIQNRSIELRDQIRQTKKINKSIVNEIEEKEKENILLREQSGQIEQIKQTNKTLLRKISAYESTIILHSETPEELKKYLQTLSSQVKELEEKNQQLNQDNQQLEEEFMNQEELDDQEDDSYDSDYNPEKINELLRRSTAAFSQIKQDLKMLNQIKK
ncbi:hypothetical protein TTHERM_00370680 (macronuclear) [Tetrahymena thermophila SB210]|uniref:C2H2-type domain-containing protein n=1 Tax=Tetrahymena thermophila (strain SB210) TaxID=312017 RepID=I7M0J8_TETTS|nr:hypothetical protein TTHERM_00370680 [Tetrahymena thermophila SB210]EAR89253.1 hypothetical protein TTHERM_00370680 [Tetrahymena thermophila SB210]|eukprot:XP_001009498.1 hypothetical protein TTHERM_00370680 [Tetrahymena thermophila SB210]